MKRMTLKRKYVWLLISSFICLNSCQNDTLSDVSVIESQWQNSPKTELDEWIEKKFSPYNIEVLYRWDKSNLPAGTIAYPPQPEKIRPVLEAIEALLFNTYTLEKAGGADFFKDKGIIRLILLGGYSSMNGILLNLREETAATNEIFVYGVNSFNPKDPKNIYRLMNSIHHQFARRLIEKIPYDRDAFADLSKTVYGTMRLKPSPSQLYDRIGLSGYAHRQGFYTLHSMTLPEDDFAQIITTLLLNTPVEIAEAENKAGQAFDPSSPISIKEAEEAQRRLVAKREFTEKYFKEKVGINIRRLQLLSLKNIALYNKKQETNP